MRRQRFLRPHDRIDDLRYVLPLTTSLDKHRVFSGAYDDSMIGRIDEVVFDCTDPAVLAQFWARVLGGQPAMRDDSWHFVDVPGFFRLAFQRVPEGKSFKNRLHLDVAVPSIDVAVEQAVELGATVVGNRHSDAAGSFQVLLDPEGNEWCLVTPPPE